ncbi:GMC family oxidoreductase [Rhizorhabdus wittichii]|uniref:GMC family oxidoreductase n=1 Tax=Rhizorhabdus wittichii TaxID=160791 RepID=A0A975D5L0_9SPHN|nr:GMC family oxidoreductase [Rhizorhabdus wittichii]QTH23510.1 GMC family oxidoreductase [Rhizorhabdus wittichii]
MRPIDPATLAGEHFDTVVVGSGFGAAFFVRKLLERRPGRILIVEWGRHHPHDWQVAHGTNSALPADRTYRSDNPKPWHYTVALGGGTNCWFGQAPRFHPSDFKLRSRYGVGNDWPIDYADLEPYYGEAEAIMAISGDPDMTAIFPRSIPYPQPPHHLTTPDRIMKKAQPEAHFAMPTARARVATEQRPACCASFTCQRCPADAKFTANNGLMPMFGDERVTVALRSKALRYEGAGNSVSALVFEHAGKPCRVTGDLFVLGANAIQSPAILQRSSMGGGLTGKGLHESLGTHVEVLLDGMNGFDGSTITTGINFGLYDGDHRGEHGAALVYFDNRWTHGLRAEKGRWRQSLPLMIVTEDLLEDRNHVTVDGRGEAVVSFVAPSDYAERGQAEAFAKLPRLLEPLPVEDIVFRSRRPTESHLQGTLRMGEDPATSVIDAKMIHHRWRNLVVVGSSAFATCSCANPSLTVAALSLRAAAMV